MKSSARWRDWQMAAAFCVTARLRVPCRAGDLARRMGFAALQGFRDDASIVPPTGLAEGWRLCIATHSRPQCRAGDLASRLGFAASQGLRDDASIVLYGCGAGHCRSLQEAALKGKPSPLPLRAAFCAAALFAGRRFCQGVFGKAPALLMDRIRPRALSPVCRGVPLTRPVRGVCGRAASRSADKARSAPRLRPARPAAPRRWRAAGPGRP